MDFLFFLLDGTPVAQQKPGGGIQMWIMLGLLIVVFYFFMIRPQNKRQKELKKFRESLKVGDKVITTGGIYGKIAQIKEDNTVLVEVDTNVRIKFDMNAIVADPTSNTNTTQNNTDVKQ
jgi:preprotein translocase subunit YajC